MMMTDTTYAVKNVKEHRDMSEETLCFSCSIYADGKRIATASNRGCGGSHEYTHEDWDAFKALEQHAAEWSECSFEPLDDFVYHMIDEFEWQKKLRRDCRKKTLFRTPDTDANAWRVLKSPFSPAVKTWLTTKFGAEVVILNETI